MQTLLKSLLPSFTSDNAQTQLMSMVMTCRGLSNKALKPGFWLCGPGGDIALTGTPPKPPRRPNPRAMRRLRGYANASCRAASQLKFVPSTCPALAQTNPFWSKGVGVAAPPAMGAAMMEKDAQIWSF